MATAAMDHGHSPLYLPGLARNWWLLLLRGIASIAFGVLAFLWPQITLLALVFLYGAYALTDGILAIVAAIRGGGAAPRWWLTLVGIVGIGAGIVTFLWPGMTALVLIMVIGAWALVRGVLEIMGAIRLRKEIDNEWLLVLDGALSMLFGVIVFAMPGASALALIWLIAAFAIVSGVLLVGFAIRLKRHAPDAAPRAAT